MANQQQVIADQQTVISSLMSVDTTGGLQSFDSAQVGLIVRLSV